MSIVKAYDAAIVWFDGEYDHVYALIDYHSSLTLNRLVNTLRGASPKNL